MKKRINLNKGITLIALVITIIVLLILAGVTIAMLVGNNGILTKTTQAKQTEEIKQIEEEIKLLLNEWQIQSKTSNTSLENFLEEKKTTNKIDEYKKLDHNNNIEIYKSDYFITVNEHGSIVNEIQAIKFQIEATYQILSTKDETFQIEIQIKSQLGIQKVICPNNEVIEGNNQKNITIPYEIQNNINYTFIIESQKEQQNFVIHTSPENIITISEVTTDVYPIIRENGIHVEQVITIQYPQEQNNYYSLDNGETWLDYNGNITISEPTNIKAKSVSDHQIMPIVSKDVTLNLATNAITQKAFDGDTTTSIGLGMDTNNDFRFLMIDNGMKNRQIRIIYSGALVIRFYDENNTILSHEETNNLITIPENAVKVGFAQHRGGATVYLREINVLP